MQARVSHLESFRQWRDDEGLTLQWLIDRICGSNPSPAMQAGTAFHKAMELANYAEFENLSANGYTFQIACDCEIEVPKVREIRGFKKYGSLEVSGQCDGNGGKLIIDHKTTAQFDPDRFMFGYQWRFYLDIFEADIFRWNVFVIRETDNPTDYLVTDYHRLEQRRYPELHEDCANLSKEYTEFARINLANIQLERSLELSQQDVETV